MSELKEIQIRRRETKNHLPAPITAESKKYLSSVLDGGGPLRPQIENEKELLAKYLGKDPTDSDFGKVVREFWADIREEIPSGGKVLNITVREQDGKKEPVNIHDWLVYQFALAHPFVTTSKDKMLKDSNKMFFIYDPDVEIGIQNRKVSFKKKAYEQLIKLGDDEEKIDKHVRLLSDSDPEKMGLKQKQNYLDQLIEEDPERFVIISTDKDLEIKATVSELVEYEILTKIGNQYWFIDEKVGDTLEETVKFFKDKKRSQDVNRMKAKLQEKKK